MILDASALLAFLHNESGADQVAPLLRRSVVSSINHSETLCKLIAGGLEPQRAASALRELGYSVAPFTEAQALITATLFPKTRHLGFSLADRACLALAIESAAPVVTTDRVWSELELGIEIRLIR